MVHFADNSMRARFPKKVRTPRMPLKYYECHHCGERHPFNIYYPTVRDPPVILGECRSCGTTTKEHVNDCQYVAIKDNIDRALIAGAKTIDTLYVHNEGWTKKQQ